MKLDTFFEKFDVFADTPDAVAKMRELILWSAFSGAFSAQERNQPMPEEWAVGGAPTLPAIPSSWKWQRGSEVFEVIRGVSYKKNDASDSRVEGSFPVLRANNIGNGINFEGLVYVPLDNIRDEQFVRRGDILIAMSSGSKKLVGKAAPIVSDFVGSFGAFCGIIRNKSPIPDEVLAQYFQSPQYTSWVTAAGRGIGINNLGRGDLDSLPVPTPPLAEQKRIVAKVDELMALCDRLEAQQQVRETQHAALARASLARFADAPTPANLDLLFHKSYSIPPADLRKSILSLAVRGKLVPQDPNDEPAANLLAQIGAEKRQLVAEKKIRASDEAAPIAEGELAFDVPEGWQWARLSTIVRRIHYGYTASAKAEIKDVRLLRITDIQNNSVDWDSVPGCEIAAEDIAQYRLERGDILVARTGGTVGKTYLVRDVPVVAVFASYLIRIQGTPGLSDHYLKLFLESPTYWGQLEEGARGAAQPNVNGQTLGRMVVSVPPLAEQGRIVARVDELMALVDELEARLATARKIGSQLVEAVVAELTHGRALT